MSNNFLIKSKKTHFFVEHHCKLQLYGKFESIAKTTTKRTYGRISGYRILLFSLELKFHTFIGFNMTRDCRVYLYVRLVRINFRQYDLLIS